MIAPWIAAGMTPQEFSAVVNGDDAYFVWEEGQDPSRPPSPVHRGE